MCSKISFNSKDDANAYIRITKASMRMYKKTYRSPSLEKLKPYVCPICGLWHLTSKKKLKGNQKRAHDLKLMKS